MADQENTTSHTKQELKVISGRREAFLRMIAEMTDKQRDELHARLLKLRNSAIQPHDSYRERNQAITTMRRFRVLYLKKPLHFAQPEVESPWFYSRDRAEQARRLLAHKYGPRNAIIYID